MNIVHNVPGHEGHDKDVGDGNQDKDDAGQDKKARIHERPVPDKYPGKIEDEVDGEGDGDRRGGYQRAEVEPGEERCSHVLAMDKLITI